MTQLNSQQLEAVGHNDGALLVLAGAGSGKTRIITQRIVRLIQEGHAFPGEILAVTFTNKAANEMRERVSGMLYSQNIPSRDLWISTFHSTCVRILREQVHHLGYGSNFSIYDQGDQKTLLKKCLAELKISDKILTAKKAAQNINRLKNEGISPVDLSALSLEGDYGYRIKDLYSLYQQKLKDSQAFDFGDLLLSCFLLFSKNQEVLSSYQNRFKYILVDEFQDTNPIQYKWLQLLSQKSHLTVVGDEDQSIYRWRGADIKNILNFKKDYPKAKIIKLEENYRSTSKILSAANSVIKNNSERLEKTLFTNQAEGDDVEVHALQNEKEEARFVCNEIQRKLSSGEFKESDVAIFYRTNAQSRAFEDNLRYKNLYYKIYGSLKFYERAEIKDVIAYFRVLVNPSDSLSLLRIINVPTRGIGKKSIEKIEAYARQSSMALLEGIGALLSDPSKILSSLAKKRLQSFFDLYTKLVKEKDILSLSEFYHYFLNESSYLKRYEEEATVEAQSKIENLKEFSVALEDFEKRFSTEATMENFLEQAALVDQQNELMDGDGSISLMTLHMSKGLEYPLVFLVGLEDGLFPSLIGDERFDEKGQKVEEERRLCYVGMTRAQKKLIICRAKTRRIFGNTQVRQASRFLQELPEGEIKSRDHCPGFLAGSFAASGHSAYSGYGGSSYEAGGQQQKESSNWQGSSFGDSSDPYGGAFVDGEQDDLNPYRKGIRIKHKHYGLGTILKSSGKEKRLQIEVRFDGQHQNKKFFVSYAPIEVINEMS